MITPEQRKLLDRIELQVKALMFLLVLFFAMVGVWWKAHTNEEFRAEWFDRKVEVVGETPEEIPEFENGIHLATGFIQDENVELVIGNCTNCHSAKMVTQNRATREGWKSMIVWMQETQGLWQLGDNEPLILDYLAKHYAPKKSGRRAPLTDIEWYKLED